MLAGGANVVYGVDVSGEAIDYAKKKYMARIIVFKKMNAENIRFMGHI